MVVAAQKVREYTQQEKVDALDLEIAKRLAPYIFWEFCEWMNFKFFRSRYFLKEVADLFQWIIDEYKQGRARKGAVSMPPRAGKSYITSLFCAWFLAQYPELSVMRNTCTGRLYQKFSRDVRAIIQNERFQAIFPHIKLHPSNKALEGWSLTSSTQVGYFGAGVGGTIIGFGANLAVSDDLYRSFKDAMSPTINENTHEWKDGAHDSRFELNCPEIFIGTRWSKRDVIGVAEGKNRIDRIVRVPALRADKDGKMRTFCEAVHGTKHYLEVKENVSPVIWEAEYQQEPAEMSGLVFPLSELQFYDPDKLKFRSQHKAGYIDPADKGGDDLSAPFTEMCDGLIYVPWVIYNKDGTEVNEITLVEKLVESGANAVRGEANGGWTHFLKDIRKGVKKKLPGCDFRQLTNSTSKDVRIIAAEGMIKRRFVFRSDWEKYPQYKAFILNLTSYLREGGSTQHDDAPDSLAGLAVYYKKKFPSQFKGFSDVL